MSETLRIEKPIYGGFGLAHLAEGSAVFVPFALAGEVAEVEITAGKQEAELLRVLEASPARTEPACPHFGACGGCHLQMASYDEQLRIKREVLQETLQHAGVTATPAITAHASPSPWHYRNRIRLHVVELDGTLRLGYRRRASQQILPIDTCPIAAPLLWNAAEILVQMAATDPTDRAILSAAREIEFFCDAEEQRLQITLMITASSIKEKLAPLAEKARSHLPQLSGMAVARMDPRSGQLRNELQSWGAPGLVYTVERESFWVARGGFFQVNRFLIPQLVELACNWSVQGFGPWSAWDLFAGVGLFTRFLGFVYITAVEANPISVATLRSSFGKNRDRRLAVESTTLAFLQQAVVQRDRPHLIVIDPPRAGVGLEVCQLLLRIAPRQITYVSCDPTTLARDLAVLQTTYRIDALHLVDLFPQTFHIETVAILIRTNEKPSPRSTL